MPRQIASPARIAAVLLFCLVLCQTAFAVWIGSEGDEWLRWSSDKKRTYIIGLVAGISTGYARGCSAAEEAIPNVEYAQTKQIGDACNQRFPLSSQTDQLDYVRLITEFYNRYPKQRFHYIREVLLELNKGLTVDQVHEHLYAPPPIALHPRP